MTDTNTKPDTKSTTEPERVSLSFTQFLASVLAAVSASLAASVFGVAGTLIGAALGSAISVLGGFLYARSLERSRQAVRLTLGVAAARRQGGRPGDPDDPDRAPDEGSPDEPGAPAGRRHRLRVALTPQRLALGAGALFVLTMSLITGFELLTGQPVAASVEGQHGSGVSVLGGNERSSSSPAPTSSAPATSSGSAPSSAPSSASSIPSGTSVPTPTVTVTVTPSATPSATQSAVPPSGSSAPTAPSGDGGGSVAGSSAGTPGGG
jgi:hypothetical protein